MNLNVLLVVVFVVVFARFFFKYNIQNISLYRLFLVKKVCKRTKVTF
jgi:hypothetical protein